MLKFIKNLFTKKKQFTLDDFDLSRKVTLKFYEDKKNSRLTNVFFHHPLTGKLWPMPSRKVALHSKWTLLKQGKLKKGDQKTIDSWTYWDEKELCSQFQTVNDLRIYFEGLERKYSELHP